MSKIKAVIDFTGYSGADFAPVAQTIHDQMIANAATFPAPPVSMATLLALIGVFQTALATKASRATADTLAYNLTRQELEGALAHIGGYVNSEARGDATIVNKSGFPSYVSGRVATGALPAAPENLRLFHGALSGSILARCRPQGQRSMNQVQTCTGDPSVEANWKFAGMFSGGRAVIGGLTVGSTVWVRVATAGRGGAMGPWSDPAKIVVV